MGKTILCATLLLFIATNVFSQKNSKELFGTYSDTHVTLTLLPDSTFEIITSDNVFPYTAGDFNNKGNWIANGNTVILNPGKAPRLPKVTVTEQEIVGQDSIRVQLTFFRETYRAEEKINTTAFPFEMLTLYINKKKAYFNLRHQSYFRGCLFAPPVRHVRILDSTNSVKLPLQEVQKIGVFTYGFDKAIEVPILNPKANFLAITIVQPLDEEQVPRSRRVILKRGQAFYYEHEGHISTSQIKDNGLKKKQ